MQIKLLPNSDVVYPRRKKGIRKEQQSSRIGSYFNQILNNGAVTGNNPSILDEFGLSLVINLAYWMNLVDMQAATAARGNRTEWKMINDLYM